MRERRRIRGGRARRPALALVATVVCVAAPPLFVSPAAAASAFPKFLGPVLSQSENPNVTLGRDGGFSVPLPNGTDFWLFADTPRFVFKDGGWRFAGFIPGSTAAVAKYTPGRPLLRPLTEIHPGRKLRVSNKPAQFLPTPSQVFMPGQPGKACRSKDNSSLSPGRRWPTGAALMPGRTNILISYAIACAPSRWYFATVGWGFALFNWRTRTFSQPIDVFPPQPDGSSIDSRHIFGSPIVVGNKVTFFSFGSGEYTTTVDAALAALRNPASYQPVLLPNVFATQDVAPPTARHARYTMLSLAGSKGEYIIYAADTPTGPWSEVGTGALPKCDSAPYPCHSFALHSELSPTSRLIVSYHVPGYGPGNASKHPYPHEPLRHVVISSIPCSC
jgi:hypothetical protein